MKEDDMDATHTPTYEEILAEINAIMDDPTLDAPLEPADRILARDGNVVQVAFGR